MDQSSNCPANAKRKPCVPKKQLSGRRFGKLVVLEATGQRKNRMVIWHCRCDCGNDKFATTNDLLSGRTRSCGCLNRISQHSANRQILSASAASVPNTPKESL